MSDSVVMDVRTPVGTQHYFRWHRRPAIGYTGTVRELRRVLRRFNRQQSSRCDIHEMIGKAPWNADREVVVGKVSPQYVLVQHDELLDSVQSAMARQGYDFEAMRGVLTTTSYGERMELTVELSGFAATPADGYPLECRLRCLNSVDGTTALEAELQWYRQICTNGMFGWTNEGRRIRRVHRFSDTLKWVQRRLAQRFEEVSLDRFYFQQMLHQAIDCSALPKWVDQCVARVWGRGDAARVLRICMSGEDGSLDTAANPPGMLAHRLRFATTVPVPGACAPVSNLYHVGQALSWVAGHADALHRRFSRTAAVPALLRHLLN
jgi:hypothetical protein